MCAVKCLHSAAQSRIVVYLTHNITVTLLATEMTASLPAAANEKFSDHKQY